MEPSGNTGEVPTSDALRKARQRATYSIDVAAQNLGISERELSFYEMGIRTPNPEMMALICKLYGVEAGRLEAREFVPRVPPRYDGETGVLWLGWTPISVQHGDNDHLVRNVAGALRSMRSLDGELPVYLRSTELPLLATLLDLSDEQLPDLFMQYLRVTQTEALTLVNDMVMIRTLAAAR